MSKTKTHAEMLKVVKQDNKTAREKRANLLGFNSASDLILYLEAEIKNGHGSWIFNQPKSGGTIEGSTKTKTVTKTKTTTKTKSSGVIPIIHIADVLDSSGSMYGLKSEAAIKGINIGVGALKSEAAEVIYTYTLCDFSDDIIFRHILAPLSSVREFQGETRGSTALYDAIGRTIDIIKPSVKEGDKVLINIYTDGQENSSRHFNASAIKTLIESLSPKGWTFTFIGTEADVAYAQRTMSIKASNTLAYDGTGQGLENSFIANTAARSSYSSKVSAGEDVSEGFYKDIN